MTVKAEMELRREADAADLSNGTEAPSARPISAARFSGRVHNAPVQSAKTFALPQFSPRQVYFTIGLYGVLLTSALWASVNALNWIWHKLL